MKYHPNCVILGIPDNDGESQDAVVFGFLTFWFISEVREPK